MAPAGGGLMASAGSACLVSMLLLNFYLLGSSRLRTIIYVVAAQGVLLSVLPVLVHGHLGSQELVAGAVALVLKGITIPRMLIRALADLPIRREIEPIVGLKTCLLLGALATAASVYLAGILSLAPLGGPTDRMVAATSFATISTGVLLLTTRVKALTQVLGYLVLENGIYVFGLLLLSVTTFLVELGVLLDLFVAIFVMGIIINHISREFTSTSTARLATLRD
jgi:hydrogenase-4 component E